MNDAVARVNPCVGGGELLEPGRLRDSRKACTATNPQVTLDVGFTLFLQVPPMIPFGLLAVALVVAPPALAPAEQPTATSSERPSELLVEPSSVGPPRAWDVERFEAARWGAEVERLPNVDPLEPLGDNVLPASFPRPDAGGPAPRDWQLAAAASDLSSLPTDVPWGFTSSWLPQRSADDLGIVDLGILRAWQTTWSDATVFLVGGVGAHLWQGPTTLELPAVLFDAYLDVSSRVIDGERGGIAVGVTPGLFGDYRRIDERTWQVTGRVLGDWRVGEHWTLLGGVAVLRQLRTHWLPIGGVIWTPNEDWQLDLTIPRPRIARRVFQTDNSDTWLYLAGQFGGGAWAADDGAGRNVLVGYSDLRLLAGFNLWRGTGRELCGEVGWVFSRDISVDEESVLSPGSTWVLQLAWVF